MRIASLGTLLLALSGCAHTYAVAVSEPATSAHYIVIQAGQAGTQKVYDCVSMPDGKRYDPTCTKVSFRNTPENRPADEAGK